jgi:hypothetical protein
MCNKNNLLLLVVNIIKINTLTLTLTLASLHSTPSKIYILKDFEKVQSRASQYCSDQRASDTTAMAKPLVHMIPSQEAKWNTSAVTASAASSSSAATLETSRAVEATTTGSAVQQRQRQQQYQQQYQQSSTLSSSADLSNSNSSSSKLVGHEVTRSSTVISVTESQSTSTDTVTTTGDDDSIASYFVEQQPQPRPQQQQPQIADVSTDTAQQVWLALSEIESYIDLTRQQSTVLKEEEEAEQQQATTTSSTSQTDTTSSSSQTDMNRLLSKVSSTTSYQRLQDNEDVFEEEKKEDDVSSQRKTKITVDHTVVPVGNLAAGAVVSLPDTALPIIDEAKVEVEEEGEEVEAPTDLMSKHNKDAADLATIPAKNGGRLRFEGIFGLSMASVRNIKDKRESNVKQKGGLGKVAVVQQDGTKRDVEVVQQEDTSICTESSLSCDTGSTSSASGTTTPHGASKRIPPTANLSRSYQSLQQMRSSHRTTVSVAQASAEVFEVVSGELISSNITSPSEAMARRASSKIPTSPPTRHIAIPKDVEDAMALAALKKVASSSSNQNTEHSHHEVESVDILRAASSYSSVGAVEQSAVPTPPDKLHVKIEELEDTIELKRTKTIRPEPTAEVTNSFEETEEEEPLKVTVRNDNDTIELLRTRTHESWSAATEDNESSVHSSTVTVPTTKVFKVVVKQDASDGAVEILRSASMQSSGAANQVSTPSPFIAKGKKPLKVSFQDQVIELVRDSSTGLTGGDKDLQNTKSADSCDTTCNGSTFSTEPRPMNIVDDNAECVIEVRRPGSSSSLFSRNAPFLGPPEEEMPPPPSAEQGFVIMARSGSYTQSIRSGASPKRNIRFLGTVPVEEAEKKALVFIGQPDGPRFVAHGEEPSLPEPLQGEEATNMECISLDGSRVSTEVSIEGPASVFFQEEAAAPLKPPAPTHVSPKDTIESTPEGLEASSNIPKLPAPAKDTTSVHVAGALLEQNLESVSRRKRQLLKSRNNNRSISDSSSSNASSVEMKVIASEQKGVEVAPEDDFPDPFLCTPEHMVHVNVLGVAGIVVDRNACNSFAGQKNLPSAPEAMKMVVGIAERGSDRVSGVTAFSKTLIPSPNGKMEDGKHRHVAVWASNNEGMTPGSLVSSDLITMERVDPENPKSRYKPKFFDLTIALSKDTKQENHVALPIGVAKLKVNGDFVSHGEMITMDLPVYTLEQSQKLNEMNTLAGESPQAVQFLKLKTKDCKKSGIKGIFHRKANQLDGDMPKEQESKELCAAYAIDPTGDSMIRVQVRVETLGIDKDETDLETPNLDGVLNDEEDPCDGTASTDPTENDSLDSLKSDSLETSSDSNDGQKEKNGKKELIDKAKPRVIQLGQSDAPKSLYSTPLDVPHEATKESSETVPSTQYVSKNNKEGQTELRIFGKALMAAKKLDDEIEQVAEKLFGQNVPFSKTTPGQDSDGNLNNTTVEEDESLLIREGSLHASLSGTGDNITTGSMIGPVPTVDEIKAYLKEQFGIFALKSGEFFFPEDPNLIHDDSSSIGDATLEAFMNGQLRMRTTDSSTWRKTPRGDDDSRTYDTSTSYESEPTIALRPFGEASNDNGKKTPMETVQEEGKPIDPPTENNTHPKSPKIATIEEGDEDNGDKDDDDDDEEGTLEEENDGDDEMSFRTPPPTKRSSSRSSSSSHPRGVAESVVESLVDVLARYPLCGANYMGTASTAKKERMKVPTTLEPDLLSVGDLTAATLEQHHHQAEASTRNPSSNKSSQSRIHPYVFAPLQAAAGLFACGANADTVDDSVARRSTPIQFTRSGSSTMLRVTQTNSVLTTTDFDAEQPTGAGHHHLRQQYLQQQHHAGEDYFAEYEDFANHKHKKSTKMATPLSPPQAPTRRADPPADPPANRLTDDENSTLVGGGASTVFSAGNNTKVGNSTVESVTQKSQYSDLEWEKEDESTTMFHEDDEC